MKGQMWIGICLLVLVLSGCGGDSGAYFEKAVQQEERELTLPEAVNTEEYETEADTECCVYVCGAVMQPGVYKLPAKSRIYEAILQAGGLSEDACEDSINQAEELADGQMIKILTEKEAQDASGQSQNSEAADDGRVNINTADAGELMELPGIGAAKAESILSYREAQGGFASIEEIKNITGIKEGVYSKIKDYITVN